MKEDISSHLENFLAISTLTPQSRTSEHPWFQKSVKDLSESPVFVWNFLPAVRGAVCEFFGLLVQESVGVFFSQLENNSNVSDASNLEEAVQVFTTHLDTTSRTTHSCTSLALEWSLDLLAQVTKKHSNRKGLPPLTALNELIQLYTSCKATRAVLDLAESCFRAMLSSNPDNCINTILGLPLKYGNSFDWLLTYIGTRFPQAIVTHVLQYGLKDYQAHLGELLERQHTMSLSQAMQKQEQYKSTLISLSSILTHLANHNARDVRSALVQLIKCGLDPAANAKDRMAVPFMLKLSTCSQDLVEILAEDLNELATPDNLERTRRLLAQIPAQFLLGEQSLSTYVVNMTLSLKQTSICCVFDKLIELAFSDTVYTGELALAKALRQHSQNILEGLANHMLKQLHSQSAVHVSDFPILLMIDRCLGAAVRDLFSANEERAKFYMRILLCLAWLKGSQKTTQILALILVTAETSDQLYKFMEISNVMMLYHPTAIESLVERLTSWTGEILDVDDDEASTMEATTSCSDGATKRCRWIRNLSTLLQWEKNGGEDTRLVRLKVAILNHYAPTAMLLLRTAASGLDVAEYALDALSSVGRPVQQDLGFQWRFIGGCVELLFHAFDWLDFTSQDMRADQFCKAFCDWVTTFASTQHLARKMLVSALMHHIFEKYSSTASTYTKETEATSLLKENRASLPKTAAAMIHSGVIGRGIRKPLTLAADELQALPTTRRLWVVHLLAQTCARDLDLCKHAATQLVEHVCMDAITGSAVWEALEDMYWYRERYILVLNRLDQNEVGWDVLGILAEAPPCLWCVKPILKALLANLYMQCESSVKKTAPVAPAIVALLERFIDLMIKGKLVAEHLRHIVDIAKQIQVFELCTILGDLWRFLRDCAPSGDIVAERQKQQQLETGQLQVEPCAPRPEFLGNLRLIMQANIAKLGPFFPKMFDMNVTVSAS